MPEAWDSYSVLSQFFCLYMLGYVGSCMLDTWGNRIIID